MGGLASKELGLIPVPLELTLNEPDKFPRSPGYFTVKGQVKELGNTEFSVAFGINLPKHYFSSKERYGLIVSMHNVVEAIGGSDGSDELYARGPGAMMIQKDWVEDRRSGTIPEKPIDIKKNIPLITLLPQTPKDKDFDRWPMDGVVILMIDECLKRLRIDPERVYLTGFSHGGTCTWRLAEKYPDRFAAIAPMSARESANPAQTAERLKNMPCWMVYGDRDTDWAIRDGKTMDMAMSKVNPLDFKCTVVEGGNHFCYYNIMKDQSFWDWLLAKRCRPRKS